MRTSLVFLASALIGPLCVFSQHAQDKYTLDLTLPQDSPLTAKSGFGCGPRLSGGLGPGGLVQPKAGLALDIVSLDKGTYTLGEDLMCQVRFTNVDSKPVFIPWSPNSDYGNKHCAGGVQVRGTASLTGVLALILKTDSGISRRIPFPSLYGRYATPETYRQLEPGESASVRVKERMAFPVSGGKGSPDRGMNLPKSFAVTAEYNLDDTTRGNPFATVYSRNQAKLAVLLRQ